MLRTVEIAEEAANDLLDKVEAAIMERLSMAESGQYCLVN